MIFTVIHCVYFYDFCAVIHCVYLYDFCTVIHCVYLYDICTVIHCVSYNILALWLFREMLWTRTPLNWREVEGCELHECKEQHTRTRANSSITHQK